MSGVSGSTGVADDAGVCAGTAAGSSAGGALIAGAIGGGCCWYGSGAKPGGGAGCCQYGVPYPYGAACCVGQGVVAGGPAAPGGAAA